MRYSPWVCRSRGATGSVVETKGLPRDDIYMLLSAARDLQVTRNVDITKGIHAMLPKAVFQK
jgi:acetamidase/formamidase